MPPDEALFRAQADHDDTSPDFRICPGCEIKYALDNLAETLDTYFDVTGAEFNKLVLAWDLKQKALDVVYENWGNTDEDIFWCETHNRE